MTTSSANSTQLIKRLGKGAFGTVHEGNHPVQGRVAVKIIEREPTENDAEWTIRAGKLMVEGRHLKDAEHPNVVRVIDVEEHTDQIWLVMEYCGGGSLQSIYEKGPMPLPLLRKILVETALGLSEVHNRGLLHRDIKPANILLDGSNTARLGDFGLVTSTTFDGFGSEGGYFEHIAPEVFSLGVTSVASDVWAFGVTAYRLLCGRIYYETCAPDPRSAVPCFGFSNKLTWLPHVPKRWRSFVRVCLKDEPIDRPQSATALVNLLSSVPVDDPPWLCEYSAKKTTWSQDLGARRKEVTWLTHAPHQHEWVARTVPVGAGRVRTTGQSKCVQSRQDCIRELEKFFGTTRAHNTRAR